MKHALNATLLLLVFFVVSQGIGLGLLNLDLEAVTVENVTTVEYSETVLGERPDLEPDESFFSIILAIGIGTIIALLLVRFKILFAWKLWFFFAIFISIALALGTFMAGSSAYIIAFVLAILKLYRPTTVIHNLTELLIYPGIAILFVPLLNVFWMIMLLLIISLYDAYAVWKSKHMIKLAEFQKDSRTFAGLSVPYKSPEREETSAAKKASKKSKVSKKERIHPPKLAILGGGDIAFPLIFTGVVMESLVTGGVDKMTALYQSFIITGTTTLALAYLFFFGENKYYPAMPFLTIGAFIGYGIVLLL